MSKDSTGTLISQSNTVRILGGSSVNSIVHFLGKLVKCSTKDGESGVLFFALTQLLVIRSKCLIEVSSEFYPVLN